jgi:hypothetical protein
MPKKTKKKAKPKGRPAKPSPRSRPAAGKAGAVPPVNLEAVRHDNGVREENIPTTLVEIRVVTDAAAGGKSPPAAPLPPEPGSVEERRLIEAMEEIQRLKAAMDRRQAELIRAGKATRLNGQRELLWQVEPAFVRGLPRPSHVGRALHEKDAVRETKGIPYDFVFEKLMGIVPSPLSVTLRSAMLTLRGPGSTKAASSALTKCMGRRAQFLENVIRCLQHKKSHGTTHYWLTPKGRKLFDGWPDWRAHSGT